MSNASSRERPPNILQIHRDTLKPGANAVFRAIEEDAARACAEHNCPHPHLAIEAVTEPRVRGTGAHEVKEVWWLNAFESETEKQRVYDDYANNRPLMAALASIGTRRKDVIATEVDIFASYRSDLSRSAPWTIAGARFFVVTVTTEDHHIAGSVFEAPDGMRFVFKATRTRGEANAGAARSQPQTAVFAVRPYWGMPAQEWIDADPDFWERLRPHRAADV